MLPQSLGGTEIVPWSEYVRLRDERDLAQRRLAMAITLLRDVVEHRAVHWAHSDIREFLADLDRDT